MGYRSTLALFSGGYALIIHESLDVVFSLTRNRWWWWFLLTSLIPSLNLLIGEFKNELRRWSNCIVFWLVVTTWWCLRWSDVGWRLFVVDLYFEWGSLDSLYLWWWLTKLLVSLALLMMCTRWLSCLTECITMHLRSKPTCLREHSEAWWIIFILNNCLLHFIK